MSSGSQSDYSDSYEESESDIATQNRFSISPINIPLNFAILMNPDRMRLMRLAPKSYVLIKGKKSQILLVKVLPAPDCPSDILQIPKLLQYSLNLSIKDTVQIVSFEGRTRSDAIQVVPLFDNGDIDYSKEVSNFFTSEVRPVSIGAPFTINISGKQKYFRILNSLPYDRCFSTQHTRVVLIKPSQAPSNSLLLSLHFSDLSLSTEILANINKFIQVPLQYGPLLRTLGVKASSGVLFCGPKGSGKTAILTALASEIRVPYIFLSAPLLFELDTDKALIKLQESFTYLVEKQSSLLLVDDIELLVRDINSLEFVGEKKIVAQFSSLLERSLQQSGLVIAASTTSIQDIDPSYLKFGRFSFTIDLNKPNTSQRAEIIRLFTQGLMMEENDIIKLAENPLDGKSYADIASVTKIAINNMLKLAANSQLDNLNEDDLVNAAKSGKITLGNFPVSKTELETGEINIFGDTLTGTAPKYDMFGVLVTDSTHDSLDPPSGLAALDDSDPFAMNLNPIASTANGFPANEFHEDPISNPTTSQPQKEFGNLYQTNPTSGDHPQPEIDVFAQPLASHSSQNDVFDTPSPKIDKPSASADPFGIPQETQQSKPSLPQEQFNNQPNYTINQPQTLPPSDPFSQNANTNVQVNPDDPFAQNAFEQPPNPVHFNNSYIHTENNPPPPPPPNPSNDVEEARPGINFVQIPPEIMAQRRAREEEQIRQEQINKQQQQQQQIAPAQPTNEPEQQQSVEPSEEPTPEVEEPPPEPAPSPQPPKPVDIFASFDPLADF